MTTTDPDPAPGQTWLYARYRSDLVAGDYTFTATHELGDGTTDLVAANPRTTTSLDLTVSAPRFSLAPGDIHLFSPPPETNATRPNQLPMCVLFRATTPWERRLGHALSDGDADRAPWLGLIVLREDELAPAGGARFVEGQTVGACLQFPGAPKLTLEQGEDALPCIALDVDAPLFQRIAPSLEEVRNLCHVRRVSTEDKELLGQDDDGWFSVVLGNRILAPKKRHVIVLVSWEGHGDRLAHLSSSRDTFSTTTPELGTTRVFVLQRWRCRGHDDTANGGVSFLKLAYALSVGALGGASLAATTKAPARSSSAGFVQLSYDARDGRRRLARYRGPFAPVPVTRDTEPPFHCAEQAEVTTPVAHISYAAAFELGRVLALSDKYFAISLMRWRLGQYQGAVGRMLGNVLAGMFNQMELQQLGKLLSFHTVSKTDMLSFGTTELRPGGNALPSWSRFTGLPEGSDVTLVAGEIAKLRGIANGPALLQTIVRGLTPATFAAPTPLHTPFGRSGGAP